ncbi:cytochrome c3 family protein [Aestuariirhabdus sp. LZHN29]|uniref:cytochrome c3 family protein n=1 Tax=Aestuariirhabdus sp. LZHN29 TaxID=3417462 RepID=UPI003CE8220C
MTRSLFTLLCAVIMSSTLLLVSTPLQAEYADVVLNKRAEAEGMRPVIYPHWFHRIRFRCKVCHNELGFEMRAGANDVTMAEIIDGKFCGMCHNGQIAWSTEHCDRCHTGLPGLKSGIRGDSETSGPGRW